MTQLHPRARRPRASEVQVPPPPAPSLAPALVVEVLSADEVRVARADGAGAQVLARLALPLPYQAVVGDSLLVIGQGEQHWVIGVLAGAGRTSLCLPGDVELRAQGGTLQLSGDLGLKLSAPETTITTGSLRTFAREVTEKAETAFRWIRQRLDVRAGESRQVVDGEDHRQAKRSTILAEQVVKIDGGSVQLGH